MFSPKPTRRHLTSAILAVLTSASSAGLADTLLSESFEGLTLGPFVSPTESGGDGTDWTSTLPAGWSTSLGVITPIGNPVEFQGWRALDVDSWITTEGDQQRSDWTRGGVGARGTVMVVDPDAYDDGTNIDTGLFDARLLTPAIDLGTLQPNSIVIEFDSFFRNEVTSILHLDVSFNGGSSFANVFTIDPNLFPDGALFDTREHHAINNPGSGSLVFRFRLNDGSNDWWWAIDDVLVTGTPTAVPEANLPATSAGALILLSIAGRRLLRRSRNIGQAS